MSSSNQESAEGCNPLIDDLLLSGMCAASVDELQSPENKVNPLNPQTFSKKPSVQNLAKLSPTSPTRRPSEVGSLSARSFSRAAQSSKIALESVSKASQRFVHTLEMHRMNSYFDIEGETNKEDEVRNLLKTRPQSETCSLIIALIDILEELRLVRGHLLPLAGSLSVVDSGNNNGKRGRSNSLISTASTASLMRPPVCETNQVAMAYDQRGNRMINRYAITANLGQGAYGKVKLAQAADSGLLVAIKIIDKKHLKKKIGGLSTSNNALHREIAIMKKVRHRNCVSLHEVIDDPDSNKLFLIINYVPNGPIVRLSQHQPLPANIVAAESGQPCNGVYYNTRLVRYAVRRSPLLVEQPLIEEEVASPPSFVTCRPVRQRMCAVYLRQLVSGLRYLHKRNVVHHDIKPDNILLGTDHHVFLTDFGVSEILVQHTDSNEEDDGEDDDSDGANARRLGGRKTTGPRLGGGTLLFTAPEQLGAQSAETVDPFATDVWALGVTLYCMLVGITPFTGSCYGEVAQSIKAHPFPWEGRTITNDSLASEWRILLEGMLNKDPTMRWTLLDVKQFLDESPFQEALQAADVENEEEMSVAESRARAQAPFDPSTKDIGSVSHRSANLTLGSSVGTYATQWSQSFSNSASLGIQSSELPPKHPNFPQHHVPSPSAAAMASSITKHSTHKTAEHRLRPSDSSVKSRRGGGSNSATAYARASVLQSPLEKYNDLEVSEQEVRNACVTMRMSCVDMRPIMSHRTRAIVAAYVEGVRVRVKARGPTLTPANRTLGISGTFRHAAPAHMSSSLAPPLSLASGSGERSANSSITPLTVNTSSASTSVGSNSYGHSAQQQQQQQQQRACSSSSATSLGLAATSSMGHNRASMESPFGAFSTQQSSRPSQEGLITQRHFSQCGSQSLDAILSIVNLQSMSNQSNGSSASFCTEGYINNSIIRSVPSPNSGSSSTAKQQRYSALGPLMDANYSPSPLQASILVPPIKTRTRRSSINTSEGTAAASPAREGSKEEGVEGRPGRTFSIYRVGSPPASVDTAAPLSPNLPRTATTTTQSTCQMENSLLVAEDSERFMIACPHEPSNGPDWDSAPLMSIDRAAAAPLGTDLDASGCFSHTASSDNRSGCAHSKNGSAVGPVRLHDAKRLTSQKESLTLLNGLSALRRQRKAKQVQKEEDPRRKPPPQRTLSEMAQPGTQASGRPVLSAWEEVCKGNR